MELKDYFIKLCEHCGLGENEVEVAVTEDEEQVVVNLAIPQEDSGLFIGYHGSVLESLQSIVRISFLDKHRGKRLFLNINDYREQRKEKLRMMLERVTQKVYETGQAYQLRHLPAYDRFIIHSTLSEEGFEEFESFSEGDGDNRVLIVQLKG